MLDKHLSQLPCPTLSPDFLTNTESSSTVKHSIHHPYQTLKPASCQTINNCLSNSIKHSIESPCQTLNQSEVLSNTQSSIPMDHSIQHSREILHLASLSNTQSSNPVEHSIQHPYGTLNAASLPNSKTSILVKH